MFLSAKLIALLPVAVIPLAVVGAGAVVTQRLDIGQNMTTVLVSGINLLAAGLNAVALRKRASQAVDALDSRRTSDRKPRAIPRGKQPSRK